MLIKLRVGVVAAVALASTAGCASQDSGMRVEVMTVDRHDEGLGLPPPPDYDQCTLGQATGIDTNGDHKPELVEVMLKGREVCRGYDTDHDGRIDRWDKMDDQGRTVGSVSDTNGNGKVDQRWTFDPTNRGCATVSSDRDEDGKPDPGSLVDICQQAGSK
jgi:hypothetical protein